MGRREPGFADVHGMHVRGYFLCLILKHGACSRHTFTCAKLREPCSNGDPSIHNIFSLRTGREQQRLCHKESARHPPSHLSPSLSSQHQDFQDHQRYPVRLLQSLHCGCCAVWRLWPNRCSLAPSCGAPEGDLLHLAQLCQQLLHAMLELRQAGQRVWGLQFPRVVQPALQH